MLKFNYYYALSIIIKYRVINLECSAHAYCCKKWTNLDIWCFVFKSLNIKICKQKLQKQKKKKQRNAVNKLVYILSYCLILTTSTSIKKW